LLTLIVLVVIKLQVCYILSSFELLLSAGAFDWGVIAVDAFAFIVER